MGSSITINYKDIDLSISGRASIGNYIYNNASSIANYSAATQPGRLDNQNEVF